MFGDDPAGTSNVGSTGPSFHLNDLDRKERLILAPISVDMHVRRFVVPRNDPDLKTTIPNDGRHSLTINLTPLDRKNSSLRR
jgi:hypothetical protein